MEILHLVLLILAYSIGLVTLFVQFICYSRKIEFKETIFLSISFLLLITAITSTYFSTTPYQSSAQGVFLMGTIILVALATPLNVFKERDITVKSEIKTALLYFSIALLLLSLLSYFFHFMDVLQYIIGAYLMISIIYSMILVRRTKPSNRVKHREKTERRIALLCISILPITLIFDYYPEYFSIIEFNYGNPLKFTVPLLFIIIATGKLVDDIKRLSLFNPEIKKNEQNMNNYHFTKREKEIVDLIIKGATYNQISEELFISLATVKTHVSNIYRKAEVNNKIGLLNLVTK
jgi:DNA-binding CsgD family transcriptional regulator